MVKTSKVHVQYDPTFFWEFLDNFHFWTWPSHFQGLTRDTRARKSDSLPENSQNSAEKEPFSLRTSHKHNFWLTTPMEMKSSSLLQAWAALPREAAIAYFGEENLLMGTRILLSEVLYCVSLISFRTYSWVCMRWKSLHTRLIFWQWNISWMGCVRTESSLWRRGGCIQEWKQSF